MATVQISVRVDESVKMAVEHYCRSRGVAIDEFVAGCAAGSVAGT